MNIREKTRWMEKAMCAAAGPQRWQEFTSRDKRVVCHGCPVRRQCSQWMAERPMPSSEIITRELMAS